MELFSKKKNKNSIELRVVKERSQRLIAPERDWKIIFSVFVITNLCLLGFHAFLFFKLSSDGFFEAPKQDSVVVDTIDRELLEKTLEVFSQEEAELVERITSPEAAPTVR